MSHDEIIAALRDHSDRIAKNGAPRGLYEHLDEAADALASLRGERDALREALGQIISDLAEDEHPAYAVEWDNGEVDDSLYEAFLSGNYYGCKACRAAFVARHALAAASTPESHE